MKMLVMTVVLGFVAACTHVDTTCTAACASSCPETGTARKKCYSRCVNGCPMVDDEDEPR